MKNVGIIAEYNPFHNGHQYQIHKIRTLFPEKKILVMMSGDFVQRGEPAIFDKYIRTKCALSAGADIVFELPSMLATASAEHFASAAVLAFAATGVIDTLCFGAENDNYALFNRIADLLIEEPASYQSILKHHLKSGLSYPKARALSVAEQLQDTTCEDLLKQPNNILGIEYIKAIRKYHLAIEPCIIKRKGGGYHDVSLENTLSSATALRKALSEHSSNQKKEIPANSQNCVFLNELANYMPASCFKILSESEYAKPLFFSDFYEFLQYALWQQSSDYTKYFEVTDEISNSLSKLQHYPDQIEELLDKLSSKNYTNTRIRRALLNILLKHTKADMDAVKNTGYITYLRILGFRSPSSVILREIQQISKISLINKVADAYKILSPESFLHFQRELQCSTLYKQAFFNKYGLVVPSEYERSVIIEKF